ncbi:Na+/H+ antiporter NhaC family protein [Shouchella lonarensis]|uniref:Sodium/proton antiporter, NhaC family n=1 Tax=Shouchella lonarensis TaxID=1464122 RepID=A0A1G6GHH1_9BACI|nr:Na+/H+ antiporter NhaC family protein [Shouchella lonarensis]SDB81390.1 sodium/proton antiporter, NhaC family [Shouchella lonarensis]
MWYSLIPPLVALVLVILTRRVLLSLGAAIVVGAFIVFQFDVFMVLAGIFQTAIGFIFSFDSMESPTFSGVFQAISAGGFHLNTWELYIILFLLLLGMMASLIRFSGGDQAFSRFAAKRIETKRGALLLPFCLGLLIFIDDYFNTLTVGNVSRPLTDRYRVSRAKLAYAIDSTAAPVCVMMPLSSWGAFIMGTMATILAPTAFSVHSGFEAFLYTIPINFYAIVTLSMLFLVIWFQIDIGSMKQHEKRAQQTGELFDPKKGLPAGDDGSTEVVESGRVTQLLYPIIALVMGTSACLFGAGAIALHEAGMPLTWLGMLEHTDIGLSLFLGGVIGFSVAVVITMQTRPAWGAFIEALKKGLATMVPVIVILLLAWITIEMITRLGTGTYLASLIDGAIDVRLLPLCIFLLACGLSLATGTSWGTFGMLLPIAGEMALVLDPAMVIPMFAAVLSGSLFGDHISPISDSTILSSAGAGSHHIDHVMTQLPYALISAGIAALSFLVLGFVGVAASWTVLIVMLGLFVSYHTVLKRRMTENRKLAEKRG